MGSADIIFDLVSTGVTLRENNLKEISGGTVMQSQGILVANKKALMERPGLLQASGEKLGTLKSCKLQSGVSGERTTSSHSLELLLDSPSPSFSFVSVHFRHRRKRCSAAWKSWIPTLGWLGISEA